MKIDLKKIFRILIVAVFVLIILNSNEKAFGAPRFTRKSVNEGDIVNIKYQVSCTNSINKEISYTQGNLVLLHRVSPFWPWEKSYLEELARLKLEESGNQFDLKITNEWPAGAYFLRYESPNGLFEDRDLMILESPGKKPRGSLEPLDVYNFNYGSCPGSLDPLEKQTINFKTVCSRDGSEKSAPGESVLVEYGGAQIKFELLEKINTDAQGLGSFFSTADYLKNKAISKKQETNDKSINFTLRSEKSSETFEFIATLDESNNFKFEDLRNKDIKFNIGECTLTEKPADQPEAKPFEKPEDKKEALLDQPIPSSNDPAKIIEQLRKDFKKKNAAPVCEGTDLDWNLLYPNYKPTTTETESCIKEVMSCFDNGISEAMKNHTPGDFMTSCLISTLEKVSKKENPLPGENLSEPSPNKSPVGSPKAGSGEDGDMGDSGVTEEEAEENAEPVDVSTKITPYINGKMEGSTIDVNSDNGRISVGARLTPTAVPEGVNWTVNDCITDNVDLSLRHIKEDGSSEVIEITKENGNGTVDADLPAGKFQNCQSYWAKLNGSGRYVLSASYPGGQEGRFKYEPTTTSGTQVTVVGARQLIQTNSSIKIDKSADSLTLTPEAKVGEDTSLIPVVSFKVIKVSKQRIAEELFIQDNYPNGLARTFSAADLGDLSTISHIEATVNYSGSDGYGPSQNDVKVDYVSQGDPLSEEPYVLLTTDPNEYEIFPAATYVTFIAATNSVVSDPKFEISKDNEDPRFEQAQESSQNCSDGVGTCEYKYTIYSPAPGRYRVTFKNGNASGQTEFTFNSPDQGQPEATGIELLYKGNTYDFSTPVSFDLELGENVFERVILTPTGDIRKSFKIIFEDIEQEAPTADSYQWYCEGNMIKQNKNGEISDYKDCGNQVCVSKTDTPGYPVDAQCVDQTPGDQPPSDNLKWYCEGDKIIEEKNGTKKLNRDCGAEGQKCRAIDTPGYESDAECIAPESSQPQEQPSYIKWYCDGNMIKQDENGVLTDYYDCGAEGQRCRLISTPGYESDAECY